jgi:hypothetical protein
MKLFTPRYSLRAVIARNVLLFLLSPLRTDWSPETEIRLKLLHVI